MNNVEYDVIVIGAGCGGLACATLLSKSGLKTLVLEQSSNIGGCCSTVEEQGFHFDTGAILVVNASMIDAFFERLGKKREDYIDFRPLDPVFSLRTGEGEYLDIPRDVGETAELFRKICPKDAENWLEFSAFIKGSVELAETFLSRKIQSPRGKDAKYSLPPHLLKFLPLLYLNYESVIEKWFCHQTIRDVLSFRSSYTGSSPRFSPGLMAYVLYAEHEVYYPKGGMISIPKGILEVGRESGLDLELNKEVTRVIIINGKVRGVELKDGTKLSARAVVSNISAMRLYLDLVGEEHLPQRVIKGIKSYVPSVPLPYINVGIKGEPPLRSQYVMQLLPYQELGDLWDNCILKDRLPDKVGNVMICWQSKADPDMAPEGHNTMIFAGPGPYRLEQGTWDERRDEYMDQVVSHTEENIWPGLSDQIVYRNFVTPVDFERRLLAPEGAAFPIANDLISMFLFHPSNRSKSIEGLYLTGASTYPGGGVFLVVTGGCWTADLIMKDITKL